MWEVKGKISDQSDPSKLNKQAIETPSDCRVDNNQKEEIG